jgi:CheY-like chemotaxis protein
MATVLIVEDDPAVRRVLSKALRLRHYDVVEVDSGEAALVRVGEGGVDAIVSDIGMPGIGGLAFYDELHRRSPDLARRLIFLTGSARDPAVHDPIEARGVPLIAKPADLAIVVDAVEMAVLGGR